MNKQYRAWGGPAYVDGDYALIARAISITPKYLVKFHHQFDAAAGLYRVDSRRTRRQSPTTQAKKLRAIAAKARRLLQSLAIDSPEQAIDGPGRDILTMLAWLDVDADAVVAASARIGRFVEIGEGIAAAKELERRAQHAVGAALDLGRDTVAKGNTGDGAENAWIAALMSIYQKVTGSDPKTSVGAPGQRNEGKATGPLIQFLEAAGRPLGIVYSADAWRRRVRTILAKAKKQ